MQERPEQEPQLSGTAASLLSRIGSFMGNVGAVTALGGVAALVVGGLLYFMAQDLRTSAMTVLAVGGLLLLLALFTSFSAVRTAIIGRRGRFSANTALMIIAFIAIAALVNFVAARNTQRLDITATKQFSLAPQTVDILKNLKEPVQAIAFFVPGEPVQDVYRSQVDDLLHEFQRRSGNFSYRFVDPDKEPSVANRYNITQYQTVLFEATKSTKQHKISTPPILEQDFTSALLIVTGIQQKKVYFLTGHSERSADDLQEGSQGFGFAFQGIKRDNYQPVTLNLQQEAKVPEDASVLVIAAPQKDLLQGEADAIQQYLKNGGRVLFLAEADTPTSFRELLAKWAIKLAEGAVVDTGSSVAGDPRTPLVQGGRGQYANSPVTALLDATFFPSAAGLEPSVEEMPETISMAPLIISSQDSWLTKDPQRNTFQEGTDTKGPIVLGLVLRATAPVGEEPLPASLREAGMVVLSDADFATNKYYYASSNSDLMMNAVNWLAGDVELISIRPKPFAFREMVLTRREEEFLRYTSWFLLPLAVALVGALAWWRRR